MKKPFLFILILLFSISLLGCMNGENGAQLKPGGEPKEEAIDAQESDEAAVASLVKDFGSKLQKVSLLGSEDIVGKSMQENYGDFLSPALLEKWMNDPLNAPGRLTSSPWPDRIEILSIEKLSEDGYEVKGEIIEITSVEKENDGVAARRPITLVVEKIEENWLINSANIAGYEDSNSIEYKNTQYGFSVPLPGNWKNYTIVTEEWEGLALTDSEEGEIVETGSMISIRHPKWTSEEKRQDIPIMIFTLDQWESLQQGKFHIGAAPMGPKELARNTKCVFALPARYNYAFPAGYEEVEEILESNPLQPRESL